jgi:hypothetical protein
MKWRFWSRCTSHFPRSAGRSRCPAVKRFAIALTRIAEYQAQDPTAACFTLALIDRSSQAEVQLQLFSRLTFQAPNPLRMTGSLLAYKALDRFIGIREAIFLDQIKRIYSYGIIRMKPFEIGSSFPSGSFL